MDFPTLRRLHLGAAISYLSVDLATTPGAGAGGDRVWAFDSDDFVLDDPASGPRLRRPLRAAFFCGEAAPRPAPSPGRELFSLAPGDYFFFQWRKTSYPTLEDGLEDFVRQVWWKGEKTEGPWILRVIAEDGDVAFQGLRSISRG